MVAVGWECHIWACGAGGGRVGFFCLPFREKPGVWEVQWSLEGLLSFLVGRIQTVCLWEGLQRKYRMPCSVEFQINKQMLF